MSEKDISNLTSDTLNTAFLVKGTHDIILKGGNSVINAVKNARDNIRPQIATTIGVTFSTPVYEALKNPANPFSKEIGAEIMYSTEKPNSEGVGVKGNGTEGVSNAGESYLSPEMGQKILEGYRFPGKNKIKGGHSANIITNDSNYYAVEVISENPDGTKYVGYYRQFSDGKISTYKKSTIFPESWSDEKIISSVKEISNTKPVGSRTGEDGITTTLHSGVIDGVKIDVIKEGNVITSGYPEGGKPTPGFEPIN